MDPQRATIPIQRGGASGLAGAASGAPGCAGCPSHSPNHSPEAGAPARAACPSVAVLPRAQAELIGPDDEVQRVLQSLGRRLGFAPDAPAQGGVRALRLSPGEVELQLDWSAPCVGAGLADAAFDTLRSLLPDTDIYVTRAA